VPTPQREGNPDLSYIEESGRSLGPLLKKGATVVLESTTYPGTTQELLAPILEAGSGLTAGADFSLGYSPERIDPGNPTHGLVNTPKVVSGVDAASLTAVQAFFDDIVERTVPVRSPKEAELTKLIENTFRHVNIALVNELAVFAHDLGNDVWEAIDAASTKPFGYTRFTPGPASAATACRSTRLPVVAGQEDARPQFSLRGAGQRRQRPHARLRGQEGRQRKPAAAAAGEAAARSPIAGDRQAIAALQLLGERFAAPGHDAPAAYANFVADPGDAEDLTRRRQEAVATVRTFLRVARAGG
jgi:hypothetical protein